MLDVTYMFHLHFVEYQTYDMCTPTTVTSKRVFIRTTNYPESNYTSNLNCACKIKTEDPGILLQILDFSLNHTRQVTCCPHILQPLNFLCFSGS